MSPGVHPSSFLQRHLRTRLAYRLLAGAKPPVLEAVFRIDPEFCVWHISIELSEVWSERASSEDPKNALDQAQAKDVPLSRVLPALAITLVLRLSRGNQSDAPTSN